MRYDIFYSFNQFCPLARIGLVALIFIIFSCLIVEIIYYNKSQVNSSFNSELPNLSYICPNSMDKRCRRVHATDRILLAKDDDLEIIVDNSRNPIQIRICLPPKK